MLVEQEHTEGNCPDVGGAVATALPGSRSAKQSEGCLLTNIQNGWREFYDGLCRTLHWEAKMRGEERVDFTLN